MTMRKGIRRIAMAAAIGSATALPLLSGCAVGQSDIHRWEGTEHGPGKLEAVLVHDKYSIELRKEAALSLVKMPARGGTRIGQKILFEKHKTEEGEDRGPALLALSKDARAKVIDLLTPELVAKITAPPPARLGDGRVAADPSIPYKDTAYALLFGEGSAELVTNPESRKKLETALIAWCNTDFDARIDNSSQLYGLEQVMRSLKAPAVVGIPALMNEKAYRVDRMATLVADLGDEATKAKGSEALVALGKRLESAEWFEDQKKLVDAHNKEAKTPATPEQLKKQVETIQQRKLSEELFPAMKKLGGRPVVEFLLAYAADGKKPEDRRKLALAALEGKIDKTNKADLDRVFAIASDDATPDAARDLAFTRLGELPKDQIVPKLYTLFEPKKWQVRYVAASLILKSIDAAAVPDFLAKLPATNKTKMALTEPLDYGRNLNRILGAEKARALAVSNLDSKNFGAKMTALGVFWDAGKKSDASVLSPLEGDKTPVPACEAADDCLWKCEAPAAGGKGTELKEVKTVGEVVTVCIVPKLK
jgi:hypothetical protein